MTLKQFFCLHRWQKFNFVGALWVKECDKCGKVKFTEAHNEG